MPFLEAFVPARCFPVPTACRAAGGISRGFTTSPDPGRGDAAASPVVSPNPDESVSLKHRPRWRPVTVVVTQDALSLASRQCCVRRHEGGCVPVGEGDFLSFHKASPTKSSLTPANLPPPPSAAQENGFRM